MGRVLASRHIQAWLMSYRCAPCRKCRLTAAQSVSLTLPSDLDDKHHDLHQRLSSLQGADFDREYMKAMVDGHEDVADLQKLYVAAKRRFDEDADFKTRSREAVTRLQVGGVRCDRALAGQFRWHSL